MNYFFGFNVGVKLYKKFPKITFYADNTLIDDIRLDESDLYEDKYLLTRDTYPDGASGDKWWELDRLVSNKFRVYKIDEKFLNNKITFDIRNSDNNYTNGFMTKSTFLYFSHMFLMPENLYDRIPELVKINQTVEEEIRDQKIPDGSKRITRWPIATSPHFLRYLGNDCFFDLPITHHMKYKHFDNPLMEEHYFLPASNFGFENKEMPMQYVNVKGKFLRILDKIINK